MENSIDVNKSIITLANEINKLFNSIGDKKSENTKNENLSELEDLKLYCKSQNIQVGLLACNAFVKLAAENKLNTGFVTSMFLSLVPDSSNAQFSAISDGIIEVLLQDLKKNCISSKNKNYICPYGLCPPQHPLIMVLQRESKNVCDLFNKIIGICNHHDQTIRNSSIEFVRSIYLHILCNPLTSIDAKTLWYSLLNQVESSNQALNLFYEILSWIQISNGNCLNISILLMDAIEYMYMKKNNKILIELIIYLSSVLKVLCKNGFDPRPALNSIFKVLYTLEDDINYFNNLLLMLLSELIHICSPIYFGDIIRIIKYLVIEKKSGNIISLYIIVDGLLQWIAYPLFFTNDFIDEAKILTDFIISKKHLEKELNIQTQSFKSIVTSFNGDINFAYHVCILCEHWEIKNDSTNIDSFIESLESNLEFSMKINLILRALFLSKELNTKSWKISFNILLKLIKKDEKLASTFLLPVLYKLANTVEPSHHIMILKNIVEFCIYKDNIPIILNTFEAFSQKPIYGLTLFLQLWKYEPRTYMFLHKILSLKKEGSLEYRITKINAIKEVCFYRSSQHGKDMIPFISEMLNENFNHEEGTVISLALTAITKLCQNHVINIVSSWKALKVKFENEKRVKVIRSLCNFFSIVPSLNTPTTDYENLLNESIERLWNYVINYNDPEIINSSLVALKNYDLENMQLKSIPQVFRKNLVIPSAYTKNQNTEEEVDPIEVLPYIPGECWVQMLHNINYSSIDEAVNLVTDCVDKEIQQFRRGIYILPEGRSEPTDLKQLPHKSPLRAITSYVLQQSKSDYFENKFILENCLRILAQKFSNPIPPMNWSFLEKFWTVSPEFRKYCIKIVVKQSPYSKSAKTIMENYITNFNRNTIDMLELQLIFEVLPECFGSIDKNILSSLLFKCMDFCMDKKNKNISEQEQLLVNTLDAVNNSLVIKTDSSDAEVVCTEILVKYFELIEIENKNFVKFVETLSNLPTESIDSLISPSAWWDISIPKLKKATYIRCYLVEHNTALDNPFHWLNPIIDAFAEIHDEYDFLFIRLVKILDKISNRKYACDWILDLLAKIQIILTDNKQFDVKKCTFLCDLFMLVVIVLSGVAGIYGDFENVAKTKVNRLSIFPECLYELCEQNYWLENEQKLIEFVYRMMINDVFPTYITDVFKDSIIFSKNHKYFQQKDIWKKYVGFRK